MNRGYKFLITLLMLLITSGNFYAQEKTITGTVISEEGDPLIGVNVIVKGTTNGTQSDFDGNYSIQANVGQTLVFSYVGFKTSEQRVGAANSIDVQMAEDAAVLDEVVVTGYGIARERKTLGYAVSTIEAEAVENKPESDVVRTLNGKIAGVQVTGTGGASGSGTNFVIRSKSSINGDNQPLFVVDGVPFNTDTNSQGSDFTSGAGAASSRVLDLDPNNNAEISNLKGLSATV